MSRQNIIEFFEPEIQKIVDNDGCLIYKMQNVTGNGIITQYQILPGIQLFYNDFHMKDGYNENKLPQPNILEINHCREGRFECEFSNGDCQYIGAGDLSIHRLTSKTTTTSFPLSHYQGISITIDLDEATTMLHRLDEMLCGLHINLYQLADQFCSQDTCFVIRHQNEIECLFHKLYSLCPKMDASYLKIKALELLMLLTNQSIKENQKEQRYFTKKQVQVVKQIEAFMTADLRRHYTLQELSKKFDIPLTSMKVCFKGVYGSSIYAYMKSYRMHAALMLLKNTKDSITEIAMKMGYSNPSKFSAVFKKEIGKLPSSFRKMDSCH